MRKLTCLLFLMSILQSLNAQVNSDDALKKLTEGNKRFVAGKSIRPNQTPEKIKELAAGQKPFAVIVGCSDSRVPNEIVFDQGLGDLFIVRTAGQVSSYASWGSMEFATTALGAKLIVVLGHTKCGAVSAACVVPDVPGHIVTLINAIKPAAEIARDMEGDLVDNAVRVNVAKQVEQLKGLEPVLSKKTKSGEIKIVGAVYHLETGKVELLPENYLNKISKEKK
ncbi:MAG: carbonic anhydrase [Leptospiraceae bacterium]|nr:carbonic anhydrase [Leptospiraceae bacterium]MBK7053749.1 carbonic anhydrase [Leptospiraceae bacterium]MBK9500128.1 carbonic anhydrase [Leptospiraceae bacterium]MBL0264323.1 carbonic anhydrase [Leptospiraceae bacterium]MBP9162850.1 carbonic anhydrase [Leptospiraceae bacterium]